MLWLQDLMAKSRLLVAVPHEVSLDTLHNRGTIQSLR